MDGMVNYIIPDAPMGGVKDSGFSRRHGAGRYSQILPPEDHRDRPFRTEERFSLVSRQPEKDGTNAPVNKPAVALGVENKFRRGACVK